MNPQDKDKIAEQAGRYFIKTIYGICLISLLYIVFSIAGTSFKSTDWSEQGRSLFAVVGMTIILVLVAKGERR